MEALIVSRAQRDHGDSTHEKERFENMIYHLFIILLVH